MEQKDLSTASYLYSRFTVFLLAVMGCFFAFQPRWLGWDMVARWLDDPAAPSASTHGSGALRLVSFGLGCVFFLVAALSFEKDQIRVRVASVMEALNQLLYGKDYARDREAIELLLNALDGTDPAARRAGHENLVRLTGQNFAPDPLVWRSWWAASQKTWARRAETMKPRAKPPQEDDAE